MIVHLSLEAIQLCWLQVYKLTSPITIHIAHLRTSYVRSFYFCKRRSRTHPSGGLGSIRSSSATLQSPVTVSISGAKCRTPTAHPSFTRRPHPPPPPPPEAWLFFNSALFRAYRVMIMKCELIGTGEDVAHCNGATAEWLFLAPDSTVTRTDSQLFTVSISTVLLLLLQRWQKHTF